MTQIGIVVALPGEKQTITKQKISFGQCIRINQNTLVALSGIGPENARAAGNLLFSTGATALISWGCAAALDAKLRSGDVILPKKVFGVNGRFYAVTKQWHQQVYQQLSATLTVNTNSLLESTHIVSSIDEKRVLGESMQAVAIDMESAAIAQIAREKNAPWLVVRTIADSTHVEIPELVTQAMKNNGEVNLPILLRNIILRPLHIKHLIRLGVDFRTALKSLRTVSRVIGPCCWGAGINLAKGSA